ncbi:MAG: right-handed parallel beta-helix repeat-containing protein [Vulcanimicrobiaceae bacterium]
MTSERIRAGIFALVLTSLTACGGGGGGAKSLPASASQPANPAGAAPAPGSSPTAAPGAPNPAAANGPTLYVSASGSDRNAGSFSAPLATLVQAARDAQPGTTIVVRGGTYAPSDTIRIQTNGSSSAHVVFKPYAGEHVVFTGSNLSGGDLIDISGSYIDFADFELRNSPSTALHVTGASHVTISGVTIHDSQEAAFQAGQSDNFSDAQDVVFQNGTVYRNGLVNSGRDGQPWPAIVRAFGASNVQFLNNTVYDNYGEGVDFILCKGGVASGNTIHDNFGAEVYLDNASNIRVEKNFIYENDPGYYKTISGVGPTPATGISIANEPYGLQNIGHDDLIDDNIVIGGNSSFYYGDFGNGGGLVNDTIANNDFFQPSGRYPTIAIEASSLHRNTLIANNIFAQGDSSGQNAGVSTTAGLTFEHNLWYGGSAGNAAGSGDVAGRDPHFAQAGISAGPAGFALAAGSPAVDAGTTVPAVTSDWLGNSRPLGPAYDIGAFEYP